MRSLRPAPPLRRRCADQRRARQRRPLHPPPRLRPRAPAHRGERLRLGLVGVRWPGHDHGGRGHSRDSRGSPSTWAGCSRCGRVTTPGARGSGPSTPATRSSCGSRARRHRATPCASPSPIAAGSAPTADSSSSRTSRGGRTGGRCTAAAAPTATRTGSPPRSRRTTRRRGISSPPCPPSSRWCRMAGWCATAGTARSAPCTGRRSSRPPTYLLSIVAAPLVRLGDRWREIPVDYYAYAADTAVARPLFALTPDVLDVFARLTGVAYPWPKYAQSTVADYFGGMENVNASTLADWLPDQRAQRRPAVVPPRADPARGGAPVVRELRHARQLGAQLAERGLRAVHGRAVLGREAGRRGPPTTTTWTTTRSIWRWTGAAGCRSRRWDRTTSTRRAPSCCGCSSAPSGRSGSARRSSAS